MASLMDPPEYKKVTITVEGESEGAVTFTFFRSVNVAIEVKPQDPWPGERFGDDALILSGPTKWDVLLSLQALHVVGGVAYLVEKT